MILKNVPFKAILLIIFSTMSSMSAANGEIGDQFNDLKANLSQYEEEVNWFIDEVNEIVHTYEMQASESAVTDVLIDNWESVDFHAAIETNYIQIYASIWQGIYGVKSSIDEASDISLVTQEKINLERSLWQALGAVKLAAKYQQEGVFGGQQTTGSQILSSSETLEEIKASLDRSVAKFAERLPEEATDIVLETYLQLFEGLEGDLITQNADLVEDLEKDFNVTLPQALNSDSTLSEVRSVVESMKGKLDRSKVLLGEAENSRLSLIHISEPTRLLSIGVGGGGV